MSKQHEAGREGKKKPQKSSKERKLEKLQKKMGHSETSQALKVEHSHD